MSKKAYIIIFLMLIFGCFISSGVTYVLLEKPFSSENTVDNSSNKNDSVYSSCSNCMSGTMIVNNEGISQSVKKAYDSVVMIENLKNGKANGSGSGVVYKKEGNYAYIMTNYHVISGATSTKVTFANEEKVDGKVLGGDEYLDIAIVRVPASSVIAVATIGSSSDVELGDTVFAIGTPVGEEYFNTVTSGNVSGLNRKVTVSVKSTSDWIQEVIQIDAAINPGNSGGPLFNFNGEVIGINSLKLVDSSIEGMGFAIKIEDAMKHVGDLEQGNKIERPLLGITHVNVTDTASLRKYGVTIDSSITYGVAVLELSKGSGASKAGLQKGDVIVKLGSDKVTNVAYLKYLLYKYNSGDTIDITYVRGTTTGTVKVTLSASE